MTRRKRRRKAGDGEDRQKRDDEADVEGTTRTRYEPHWRGRRFATAVEEDKDMKQVSYIYCFVRDQPRSESAKILVSNDRAARLVLAHVVSMKGASS